MKALPPHQRNELIEQIARAMSWNAEASAQRDSYRARASRLVDELERIGIHHTCIGRAIEALVPDDEAVA